MASEKNVILITIDCLRADHLGCLGYSRNTTPYLDSLAAEGILYSSAFSVGPITSVSFMSLLTSTYPLMYTGYLSVSRERTTLAEILSRNRYHTAAFHSNPFLSRRYSFDRGFDTFYDSIKGKGWGKKVLAFSKKNRIASFVLKKAGTLYKRELPHEKADEINKKVISWIQECSPPFFLWVHYMDVHAPYSPPKQYMAEFMEQREIQQLHEKLFYKRDELSVHDLRKITELYDAEIRYVDQGIQRLLNAIGEDTLANTLLVVTSDHGDEFGEHKGFMHEPKLYDELLHVPLIMKGPGLEKAVVTKEVSLLDVAPTILAFLGIEPPRNFQGESILKSGKRSKDGVISEVSHGKYGSVEFDLEKRKISYRTNQWKYIYSEEGFCELYNVENDPGETKNVIKSEIEKAEEFRSKIMEHIRMEDKMRKSIDAEKIKIKEGIKKAKLRTI
jgi:arylsulfatase A-like enzyme